MQATTLPVTLYRISRSLDVCNPVSIQNAGRVLASLSGFDPPWPWVKVAASIEMKTQWGGCNHRAGTIRLNTELVKKPVESPP